MPRPLFSRVGAGLLAHLSLVVLLAEPSRAGEGRIRDDFEARNPFALRESIRHARVDDPEMDLYRGFLAANFRETDQAELLLRRYLAQPGHSSTDRVRALSLLAGVFLREGRYAEALKILENARQEQSGNPPPGTDENPQQLLAVAQALARSEPQRVLSLKTCRIALARNRVGLPSAEIAVNGLRQNAILDTGANYSVASESFARESGLHLLEGDVRIRAATGKSVRGRLATADLVQIGECRLADVVFLVLPDRDLSFPGADHHIRAIAGFPILSALGTLRIWKSNTAELALAALPLGRQNLALDGLTPLVEVRFGPSPLHLILDSGAATSSLSAAFSTVFPALMRNSTLRKKQNGGAGGTQELEQRILGRIELSVADTAMTLARIPVAIAREDEAARTYLGVLGNDALLYADGCEFDFETLQLRLLSRSR